VRAGARLVAAVCHGMCATRNSGLGVVERGISRTRGRPRTTLSGLRGEVLGVEVEVEVGERLGQESRGVLRRGVKVDYLDQSSCDRCRDALHNRLGQLKDQRFLILTDKILTQNTRTRTRTSAYTRVHTHRCHDTNRILPLPVSIHRPSTPAPQYTLLLVLFPSHPRALFLRRMRRGPLQSLCFSRSQRLPLSELSI